MKNANHNNNFTQVTGYFLLLLSFAILLLFTKNVYASLQVSLDEQKTKQVELSDLQNELQELNQLRDQLRSEQSDERAAIEPFMKDASQENVLSYLFDYAQSKNNQQNTIIFRSISFSKPSQNDIGFDEVSISVSALFAGENSLLSFLNYITDPDSKYRFFIGSFSYPMNDISGNLQVDIPLTLFIASHE